MLRRFWPIFLVMLLGGCGWNGSPTRLNEFTPLTSLEIIASPATIAQGTSIPLTVRGNFSGIFTRDITDQVTWSSDTPGVAEFITTGQPNRVSGHIPGSAVITATVGKVSGTFTLTVSNATIQTLTVSPATPSIPNGRTEQLAVSGTFSDNSTQDLTFDASWASSDSSVATVSDTAGSKGLVRGLALGTATINASFGGLTQGASLTVTAAVLDSISISTLQPSVLSLSSTDFIATGVFSDNSTADITTRVAWSSSRTDVATVPDSDGNTTALAPGSTTIGAFLDGVSAQTTLKVTGGSLTGITLSPANFTMVKGTTLPITATGTFNNGSSRDISGIVTWAVASAGTASVTPHGGNLAVINAIASGTPTTVTAKVGTVTGTTNLTVSEPLLQSLTISSPTLNLNAGTSARLTLKATFNGNPVEQDVTFSADWTSSDATKASSLNGVADRTKGRIEGTAAGTATISAAYGGLTATTEVAVNGTRTLQSLVISPLSANVTPGTTVKFTAIATYNDTSQQDVTEDVAWTIDNARVAVLADISHQPGQVIAVDSGTATLKAELGGKTGTTTVQVSGQ